MKKGILHIDRVKAQLRTRRIGRSIEHLETTSSTNDEAWRRIEEDQADGLVVFAEHQADGRGRMGRSWHSPRGASLLLSVVVVDDRGELDGGELGLLTAVAVCDALRAGTDVSPTIKWPNDLTVAGRKLSGILIESRARDNQSKAPSCPNRGVNRAAPVRKPFVAESSTDVGPLPHGRGSVRCDSTKDRGRSARTYVIGVGINCLQQKVHFADELKDSSTSLEIESVGAVDRESLAVLLLGELDRWLAEPTGWTSSDLRDAWMDRADPVGQPVRLRHDGKVYSGSIVDLDPSAALIVRLDEGGTRVFDAASTTVVHSRSADV